MANGASLGEAARAVVCRALPNSIDRPRRHVPAPVRVLGVYLNQSKKTHEPSGSPPDLLLERPVQKMSRSAICHGNSLPFSSVCGFSVCFGPLFSIAFCLVTGPAMLE